MAKRKNDAAVKEAPQPEPAAPPKKRAARKAAAEPVEVFLVTTPHGDGMRVFGVYSSEKNATVAQALADPRNRLEVRVLDAPPE